MKSLDSDACSKIQLELDKGNDKRKHIIDVEPSAIIATIKMNKIEPEDLEEWECLFHFQIWVRGSLLQFVVNSGSQYNLILVELMKRLGLPTTPHLQSYTIGWI